MTNDLVTMLGIRVPVIQAPMGGAVGPRLAAAVCNAGGLGTLPLWACGADDLRRRVRDLRARTSASFAVNLNASRPQEAHLEACLAEGVPAISLFWGLSSALIARANTGGAVVLQTVASAAEARAAVDLGADVVVAQGWEAGGHVAGSVTTMALVPAVVDAVDPIPVVAAGGITDARTMVAALALGASGVWVGTRFLASEEAEIHPEYTRLLLAADETGTGHYDNLFDRGWPDAPHRVLRNSTTEAWEASGRPPHGDRPGEGEVVASSRARGPVVRYQCLTPGPDIDGEVEALSLWAGQGVGAVRRVMPAAAIVREFEEDARAVISRIARAQGVA
jgi:nitronate monooxygenase